MDDKNISSHKKRSYKKIVKHIIILLFLKVVLLMWLLGL